jgi:ATP-dependent phosphofructokinase / diphosphate-dependent phosphofructokinase
VAERRVGVLTGGGDCPGLNAVLRAVGKTLIGQGYEIVGFEDGFFGVLTGRYRILTNRDLSGILTLGGTIIGTSNRDNPFAWIPPDVDPFTTPRKDYSHKVAEIRDELKLECLVCIGGEGTLGIAERLTRETGVPCIGIPKTIDNDLDATDFTFGFDSAVQIATEAIDRLHTTAMSHHRAMVVELMGRNVGWLTLFAGVAGGGDIILIPEIPYELDHVYEQIARRNSVGKRFSLVIVSEGAKDAAGSQIIEKAAEGRRDVVRLGGIGKYVADSIEASTGTESRVTVLGHLQRGGSPTAFDRLLATQFGHLAAHLVLERKWGQMTAYQGGKFVPVSLAEATADLKYVPRDHLLIAAGRAVGTSFGDE